MKLCWSRSSPVPSNTGRQESNLPSTAYQAVASPLGFGPLVSALYGDRTRLTCSTGRPSPQLRHRATSKDGRSRTLWSGFGDRLLSREHVLGERKGQDSNLQGLFASLGFRPGAIMPVGSPFHWSRIRKNSGSSCPGRTRTCSRLVNSQPHHRCATGQEISQDGRIRTDALRHPKPADCQAFPHPGWVAVQVTGAVFKPP